MKQFILNKLNTYTELNSEEILNLENANYVNSPFKLNLLKDKEKGAKISETKFFVTNKTAVIKFQYDEECKKLVVYPSQNIDGLETFIQSLTDIDVEKIEFYCNSSFTTLQQNLQNNNYKVELVRNDRFLNNNEYENEVVLSYVKEEN